MLKNHFVLGSRLRGNDELSERYARMSARLASVPLLQVQFSARYTGSTVATNLVVFLPQNSFPDKEPNDEAIS